MFRSAILIVLPLTTLFNALFFSIGPWMIELGNTPERTAALTSLGAANFPRANGLSQVFITTATIGAVFAGIGRDLPGNYPASFSALRSRSVGRDSFHHRQATPING
ncbi:MAG: hypothetical protein ACLQUZ_06990 [Rhizomicrobium sp.]